MCVRVCVCVCVPVFSSSSNVKLAKTHPAEGISGKQKNKNKHE